MITFIYIASYIYLSMLIGFLLQKRNIDRYEKVLFIVISLIPLGKLVYFPFDNFPGLKFSFLFTSAFSVLFLLKILSKALDTKILFLFVLIYPAIFSLPFLKEKGTFLFYKINNEQTDSVLMRLITFILLIIFSIWCTYYVKNNENAINKISIYYNNALLFSVIIGGFIFTGVQLGVVTLEDLLPISADTHIVGKFYRFNPGANVNEFGMLLGYGMIFVLMSDWNWTRKILYFSLFIVAEFLTLTRAAWIGVIIGFVVYALLNRLIKIKWVITILFFVIVAGIAFSINDDLSYLAKSRSALDLGASGEDRLNKYNFVFESLNESSLLHLVFGFGWATNLYVHSVPLQLLYETGIVGLLIYSLVGLYVLFIFIKNYPSSKLKYGMISMVTMSVVFSLVHHTFYHLQTWLIVGILWGLCLRKNENVIVSNTNIYKERR